MGDSRYDDISHRRAASCEADLGASLGSEAWGGPSASKQATKCEEPPLPVQTERTANPVPPTNSEILAQFAYESFIKGDKNSNGVLSRRELEALPPSSREQQHLRDFLKDNFNTVSTLSTDGTFSEGGISRRDILTLFSSREEASFRARRSYVSHYTDVGRDAGTTLGFGAGMLAQAADFSSGGAITGASMLLHLGAGTVYPLLSKNSFDLEAMAVAPIAGVFWGPLYSTAAGYYGGQWLGDRMAQYRFDSAYVPRLNALYDKIDNGFSK